MSMQPKKASKPGVEKLARKNLEIQLSQDVTKEEKAEKYAKLVTSPEFAAYQVIIIADGKTDIHNKTDVPSLVNELRAQTAAVNRGDLVQAEAMLMNQAAALQTLFAGLTERAMGQNHMPNLESFMRMALRAQNQCRATLETLATIKNPPVVFAKQANINHGNQQINNGTPAAETSRTEKTINQQNELLEGQHGSETVDPRATGKAIRKDKAMATVG